MKTIKLLFSTVILTLFINSCTTSDFDNNYRIPLEQVLNNYDLWYVDIHKTQGTGEVAFMQNAFTLSFINGNLYANNNLAGIGNTGNGLGIIIGSYTTHKGFLEINHIKQGYFQLDVIVISQDVIQIRDNRTNVTYYLEGYKANRFDYNKLFFENIEYFLQEYHSWEKTYASEQGSINKFDNENFLGFEQNNGTMFYSSKDKTGTNIANVKWDYEGNYQIFDVTNSETIKILTLNYSIGEKEEFELSVVNDEKIELYHIASKTTYLFEGRQFLQYLRPAKTKGIKETQRKRIKIIRKKYTKIYKTKFG